MAGKPWKGRPGATARRIVIAMRTEKRLMAKLRAKRAGKGGGGGGRNQPRDSRGRWK